MGLWAAMLIPLVGAFAVFACKNPRRAVRVALATGALEFTA